MGRNYKRIRNGKGTDLTIDDGKYISVGKGGADITIRGSGIVAAFDSWEDFINAIDLGKAAYFSKGVDS